MEDLMNEVTEKVQRLIYDNWMLFDENRILKEDLRVKEDEIMRLKSKLFDLMTKEGSE